MVSGVVHAVEQLLGAEAEPVEESIDGDGEGSVLFWDLGLTILTFCLRVSCRVRSSKSSWCCIRFSCVGESRPPTRKSRLMCGLAAPTQSAGAAIRGFCVVVLRGSRR